MTGRSEPKADGGGRAEEMSRRPALPPSSRSGSQGASRDSALLRGQPRGSTHPTGRTRLTVTSHTFLSPHRQGVSASPRRGQKVGGNGTRQLCPAPAQGESRQNCPFLVLSGPVPREPGSERPASEAQPRPPWPRPATCSVGAALSSALNPGQTRPSPRAAENIQ